MKALVVGGTGPSGPDVVAALLARSFDVAILHRGQHEPAGVDVLEQVEYIHADPHFRETLEPAVRGRDFDVVVAMYGRMALNASVFAGRCARFVSVGGNPAHRGHLDRRSAYPEGMQILAGETAPTASGDTSARDRFAAKVLAAEAAVMDAHRAGAFAATHVRYPMIYSPRAVVAFERWAVRRLAEGRRRVLLTDGGLSIYSRCASANAAHLVGLVLDRPDVAAGQLYQCADDRQYSLRQWFQLIASALGVEVDIVAVPLALAQPLWHLLPTGPLASPHTLVDTTKARLQLGYADVVAPEDALRALVRELVSDLSRTDDVAGDPAAEDALLEAMDGVRTELAARFGWVDTEEPTPRWHKYDHPRSPES